MDGESIICVCVCVWVSFCFNWIYDILCEFVLLIRRMYKGRGGGGTRDERVLHTNNPIEIANDE